MSLIFDRILPSLNLIPNTSNIWTNLNHLAVISLPLDEVVDGQDDGDGCEEYRGRVRDDQERGNDAQQAGHVEP